MLKPASLTPLTALMLGDLLVEAGRARRRACRCCPGPGATVGDALVGDPRVDKISFTGDSTTGAGILRTGRRQHRPGSRSSSAGSRPRSCSPTPTWTPRSTRSRTRCSRNAGQDCCARSRLLVERSVYDEVVARVAAAHRAAAAWATRTTRRPRSGPMISEGQRPTALDYLSVGRAEGGEVVCGGESERAGLVPDARRSSRDVDNTMRIAREEIFGPVADGHPLRRRGGGDPHRQRQRLRPVGHAVDPRPRAGRCGSAPRCAPASCR